ncbi:hypothetical protein GMDG_06603 [Pseudogymnoascus destructans 20631-21]|uniref:Uncharacterized protein n=1 Tax=Pseudogymnoascus destructans (strain ATCC MYA-4855 / 20631-21) TaxID=658429 RepID=L8FWT5_PSED2|nr:hypothetical protein GMDG_06603 [Pseudogymnoascus destructans 20631-21]
MSRQGVVKATISVPVACAGSTQDAVWCRTSPSKLVAPVLSVLLGAFCASGPLVGWLTTPYVAVSWVLVRNEAITFGICLGRKETFFVLVVVLVVVVVLAEVRAEVLASASPQLGTRLHQAASWLRSKLTTARRRARNGIVRWGPGISAAGCPKAQG